MWGCIRRRGFNRSVALPLLHMRACTYSEWCRWGRGECHPLAVVPMHMHGAWSGGISGIPYHRTAHRSKSNGPSYSTYSSPLTAAAISAEVLPI